jgi:hypothetical protein
MHTCIPRTTKQNNPHQNTPPKKTRKKHDIKPEERNRIEAVIIMQGTMDMGGQGLHLLFFPSFLLSFLHCPSCCVSSIHQGGSLIPSVFSLLVVSGRLPILALFFLVPLFSLPLFPPPLSTALPFACKRAKRKTHNAHIARPQHTDN